MAGVFGGAGGAGAGAGAGAGGGGAGADDVLTAASILDAVRAEVRRGTALPADVQPPHLGVFGRMGSGKSTLLSMCFMAVNAPGPFGGGGAERTTVGLSSAELGQENQDRYDTTGLPIIFDCRGANDSIDLAYFVKDIGRLFWGYYKEGQLHFSTNAATHVARGIGNVVTARTALFPMRDYQVDAFLCTVDLAQFCNEACIATGARVRAGDPVVRAGSPLAKHLRQVRTMRENMRGACCQSMAVVAFTKWANVDLHLRRKGYDDEMVKDFMTDVQELVGCVNQPVFFVNDARVRGGRVSQEQMRVACDILVCLTRRAVRVNKARVKTKRWKASWGKDKKHSCAVM